MHSLREFTPIGDYIYNIVTECECERYHSEEFQTIVTVYLRKTQSRKLTVVLWRAEDTHQIYYHV